MVDSSVGGKVGINHPRGKNLIGAFHQPVGVWIDIASLATLPDRQFRSGLAEVVKYGAIMNEPFFAYLEANADAIMNRDADAIIEIVARSCTMKAEVVAEDEFETTGRRAILNYGHTFAHAFETIAGYGEWSHGEAVAAGMVRASRLAELRGRIDACVTDRQITLLRRFGLPTTIDPAWDIDAMIRIMGQDKKAEAGRLRFILPTRLGHVEMVSDVPREAVVDVLRAGVSGSG
jgi:3-dehydroquinate synthase